MYRIEYSRTADKEIDKLHAVTARRILRSISALSENPRPAGVKKMRGFQELYRIRVGSYRVIYEVKDRLLVILVIEIGHRKDVYRGY